MPKTHVDTESQTPDHPRASALTPETTVEVDGVVERAAAAAAEFRTLDQHRVDAIVAAMARAGVRAAAELAAVAIEETGFGVFEDKVVKN